MPIQHNLTDVPTLHRMPHADYREGITAQPTSKASHAPAPCDNLFIMRFGILLIGYDGARIEIVVAGDAGRAPRVVQ